jgi:hypothetical protein
MPVIDLYSQRQQRRIQQQMMINEMLSKSPAYGESEYDKFLKEQDIEDTRQKDEERKQKMTDAQIAASEARQKEAEGKRDLATWTAGQQDIARQAKSEREQQQLEATLPKLKAETEAAKAHTGLYGAQTKKAEVETDVQRAELEAKNRWNSDKQMDDIRNNARNTYNRLVVRALSGDPTALTKDAADEAEHAGQILERNPDLKVPRGPNGEWTPDLNKLGLTVTNEKGEYDAKFLENLRKAEKPNTPFESYLQAYKKYKDSGDEFGMKSTANKIFKETAPNMSVVQGAYYKDLLDHGDIEEANKQYSFWQQAKRGGTTPGGGRIKAIDPKDLQDEVDTLGTLHDARQQFVDLYNNKAFPMESGWANTIDFNAMKVIGRSNPDVETWRALTMDAVGRYRKFITGKASNEKEMADLKSAVPNEEDNLHSYLAKLDQTIAKTQRRIQQDMGIAQSFGLDVKSMNLPPNLQPISIGDAAKMWGKPDTTYLGGKSAHDAMGLERGKGILANKMAGKQIGTITGEARQSAQDQQQQLVQRAMTQITSAKSPEDQKAVLDALVKQDPVAARLLLQQLKGGGSPTTGGQQVQTTPGTQQPVMSSPTTTGR